MFKKFHSVLWLCFFVIVTSGNLSSQTHHQPDDIVTDFFEGPDNFFTDRIEGKEDTLYLPVEDTCLLEVSVYRFVREKKKIDNSIFLQTTHRVNQQEAVLQRMNQRIIDKYSWSPISYKKIFPFITLIYNNTAIGSQITTLNKNNLIDCVYTQEDTTYKISFFGAEDSTLIGNQIAENMPVIESFLYQKISNEVTLIYDTDLIAERVFIRIIPVHYNTPKKSDP